MNLVLTDPLHLDARSFHDLISEQHIQKQFVSFRDRDFHETKMEIDTWVTNRIKLFPSFLRMVKIASDESSQAWDNANSELIGFVSNVHAGQTDSIYSGFKFLMNFAIKKQFQNHGIMTMALQMTLEKMYDLNYTIASAYVNDGNIGSERVLEKCEFDLLAEAPHGKTYVKALKINIDKYNSEFGFKRY